MPVRIKQHDITDCGAACIASIASHFKLELPLSRIRQLAGTDHRGTNVIGLIEALEKLGFQAKGVRGDIESLSQIPMPAIAHVVLQNGLQHFLVIYGVNKKSIRVMDPGDGKIHRYEYPEFKKIWRGVLIILLPGKDFRPGKIGVNPAMRFWSLTKLHRAFMIQAVAGALIYTVIGLTTSVYVQKIIDYVLQDGNRNLLNMMSVAMIGLLILQIFIGAMKNIYTLNTGQSIDALLILGYYKHILKLPQRFFDTMQVGEIISRVNDAVKIRNFINETLTSITVDFFIVIFSFALMFLYYWKLALVATIAIPFYSLVYVLTNRLNGSVERRMMENAAALESQLVESLNAIRTIKSFGIEGYAQQKTEIRFVSLIKTVYTSGLNLIFTASSSEFLSRLFTIILLWAGAGFVLDNEITPGELLSFYALAGYFTSPVNNLIGSNKVIQNALIAGDRLFEIMALESAAEENQVTLLPAMIGDIRFRNVNFRYGTRAPVFEDFNLVIPSNRVTAIVGESGSGKSTLIGLIQKLYPLQSGRISIGDFDINQISHDSWCSLIGLVPQKIELFSGNVIDNIAIGDYEPDIPKIIRTSAGLGVLDFIERLPLGLHTPIGENGSALSGGQRQRIAVARALYKEPRILILDEPATSLDPTAEKFIQKIIECARGQNKTVIIISHRLNTILKADKIVVLENGKLIEEGTHEALLLNKRVYHKLWHNQFPQP